MISSHITNKGVSKQKVLYPMGYMVIIHQSVTLYTTSKYSSSLHAMHYTHKNISSHEVVTQLILYKL